MIRMHLIENDLR